MIDTINTIVKDIAPNLGLDESLVKKVYAHYWKTVKRSVASGEHTSIWLRGIGTLAVSRTKVNKLIRKLIWRIRDLQVDQMPHMRKTKEQMMIEALNDLRIMCARRNEIAIAYRANLDRIHATKTKRRLEQQGSNMGGPDEQDVLSQQGDGPGETEGVRDLPLQ